jgi:hypothetical protein
VTLVATFDSVNSRVQLDGSSIPSLPGLDIFVQRRVQAVGSGWNAVRGGTPASESGGAFQIFDYEFTPNELNEYRVITDFVYDTFSRTQANSWSSADSGQTYTRTGGNANDWDVGSGVGTYVMASATGVVSYQELTTVAVTDFDFYTTIASSVGTPSGGGLSALLLARIGGGSSAFVQATYSTLGQLNLQIIGNNGATTLGTANAVLASPGTATVYYRFQGQGRKLRVKTWTGTVLDEPTTWSLTVTDTVNPASGSVALGGSRLTGNTDVNPVLTFDNFHVGDLATTNQQFADLGTDDLTPLQDTVWLKFPLRPFLNREIPLCNWSDESREARGAVFPILGRRLPIAVTDLTDSRTFEILLAFPDSNDVEDAELRLSFGDVVLLQTPGSTVECELARRRYPAQGYFYVGGWNKARPVNGKPVNILTLPLREVSAPDASAAGSAITWDGVVSAFTDWNSVIANFATWLDLLAFSSDVADEIVG